MPARDFIDSSTLAETAVARVKTVVNGISNYGAIHYLINHENFSLSDTDQEAIENIEVENKFNPTKTQAEEIMLRYGRIKQVMHQTVVESDPLKNIFFRKARQYFVAPFLGLCNFITGFIFAFSKYFSFAQYPMSAIEWGFGQVTGWLGNILPAGWLTNLFLNGFVAGLSGILIFVPQIMILFGLVTIIEDSGYMARISFLTDKLMRKAGLNGKSIMPMISGLACAVPAIMSARSIENKKKGC